MRRAVRWYRNTVFEGGIYYGTIQRHRHELCSLQRPCGKSGKQGSGSYFLLRKPAYQFHGKWKELPQPLPLSQL